VFHTTAFDEVAASVLCERSRS